MLELNGYNLTKNVHVYRQGDLNIAYDVNSGSLHLLSDSAFTVIKAMEGNEQLRDEISSYLSENVIIDGIGALGKAELKEVLEELLALQSEGTLFSSEALEYFPGYPDIPIVKAICLHVAHDCNLRCRYCFAGTGSFGGKRTLMDLDTGKKAIDFVLSASAHRKQCEVDFFGGEPLLNFEVIKELVSYGKSAAAALGKKIKFTLTTNALLLNDTIQDYLEQEDISVVLSLDGRQEINDNLRPDAGGRGSYQRLVPNIQSFVKRRPQSSPYAVGTYYYVRGTYTHHNPDFYRDVLHIADLGINQISVEPVVAAPTEHYAFQEEDIPQIFESYDLLAEEILKRRQQSQGFNFFHFNIELNGGPCLPKRLSGCGAGHEYVAISPEGDIYPCHQFVGQEEFKLGSLLDAEKTEINLKQELVHLFRTANIYAKQACKECWARFFCSGGCHAANQASTNKLTEVYSLGCTLQKKRLEVAIYLKIKELMAGEAAASENAQIRC